jgi:Major Facilitator Superfamily
MSESHTPAMPANWVTGRLAAWRDVPGVARTMVLASFVESLGAGLYTTGSSVYFVRGVGLSASQVGIGVAAATLLGLTTAVPIGKLADHSSARNVTIALMMLSVPLLGFLTQVRSFWAYLPAAAALGVPILGFETARGVLMARVAGPSAASKLAMYTRSAFNAGFSLGLLGAGVAISIGTRPAYLSLFAGEATTLILTGLILLRIPRDRPAPARHPEERPTAALRDLPYVLVAQVSGLTRLGDTILTIGLPLWIVTRTAAPRGLAAWLLIVNTLLVVALQVRATRRASNATGAAQIQRWAFVALALACLTLSPTGGLGAAAAAVLLLASTVLLTFGEIWGEGAWWSLRYDLASPGAQGAYGAVFELGRAAPGVLGPVLITSLVLGLGGSGWLILAGIFLGCGSMNRWPVRLALRQRAAPGPAVPA